MLPLDASPAHPPDEDHDAAQDDLVAQLARALAERDALAAEVAALRAAPASRAGDEQLRNAFFAMASHELRTPLQSLALHLTVMLTRVRGTADEIPAEWIAGRLVRTQHVVDRMRRLVDGLLNVSEIASGRLELHWGAVDLAELAERVVAGARDALEWAGCACVLDAPEPVRGRWDRLRLEIVLDNLLSNAMKYAPGRPIVVRVGREGDRALLSVSDEGPGIAAEEHARVFERFERLGGESRVPGFGLGLWIVRTIVRAHGGEVGLESAPGAGATFTISLPAAGE